MSDLKVQFVDANRVYCCAAIALAEEVSKLPKDESTARLRRALKLQQDADKMRNEIAREALSKFAMQMQGGVLDLEVCRQLNIAAKQQSIADSKTVS